MCIRDRVTIVAAFLLKLNSDFLLMCIIGFGSLFWIVRTVAFRSNLDKGTKKLVQENVDKKVIDFVEGLKK